MGAFVDLPLTGFMPDADPAAPGVVVDCSGLIPTPTGLAGAPSPQSVGLPPLAAACQGAVAGRLLNDTSRLIAGTAAALYEAGSGAWADVSDTGGYTGGSDTRWRFAQYGDLTIATNRTDDVQQSPSGAFAALAGSPPKASYVCTSNGFVLLFDYDDGTDEFTDGWWCSGLNNPATWSPSISTQAANGRLLDTPGPIRGAKTLGYNVAAYKERSTYLGFYDGPPLIWRWQLISGDAGAASQEAVVEVPDLGHFFQGYDDFYSFDGTRPRSIGRDVRNWFFRTANQGQRYKTIGLHDRTNANVLFFYVGGDTVPDGCLVYNYKRDAWGKDDKAIEAAVEYLTAPVTYDGLGTLYAAWDNLPAIAYDSPFWTSNTPIPAYFDPAHTLQTLTGVSSACSLTTAWAGDNSTLRVLSQIRPRFLKQPGSGTCTVNLTRNVPTIESTRTAAPYRDGKFDVLARSKWAQAELNFTGDVELNAVRFRYRTGGQE